MALAVTHTATVSNPNVGDLELTPAGRLFMRTTLADRVHQRLLARLRFFRGEWFLNLDAGMPYFQHILVKAPDLRLLKSIYTQAIRGVGGVREVLDVALTFDPRERRLSVSFRAELTDGTVYDTTNYAPFLIVAGRAVVG